MYRTNAKVLLRKAPHTPLHRIVWAWCRGVLGWCKLRTEDHIALGDMANPHERYRARQRAANDYPLDRIKALETIACNARGPRGNGRVPWLPMAMPPDRVPM